MSDVRGGLETQAMARAIEARLLGEPAEPIRVGRFEIGKRLGQGGMGVVFVAHDPQLDRDVALKIVRRDPGAESGPAVARMLLEARALAKLSHPSIVPILDVGTIDDGIYLAMELIEGHTLLELEGRDPARILALARQAAAALAFAHDAGVVHRDVKPSNMVVGADGRLRLIDFGLARTEATAEDTGPAEPAPRPSGRLTETGKVVGTPAYMAPEQRRGQADPRTDQYAWALSFWELYSGTRKVPEGASAIPRPIRRVLTRALRERPAERFADMHAVLRALSSRPRIAGWIGAAAVAGAATWAWAASGPTADCDATARNPWDPATREALAASIADDDSVLARETWSRLEPMLESYAEAWTTARIEACHAGRDDAGVATTDAAIGCLQRRRRTFTRTVAVLTSLGSDGLPNALRTVGALPRIEECSDPQWLAAQVKPPSDPLVAQEVALLTDRLDAVEAQRHLGGTRAAAEGLDKIIPAAQALGYGPLQARALFVRGLTHDDLGHDDAAVEAFRGAYFVAVAHGDHLRAAEAAGELAWLYGDRKRLIDEATAWMQHMDAALERAPDGDGTLRANAEVRRASVLRRAGKRAEAIAAVEAAAERFTAAGTRARIPAALVVGMDVHRELGEIDAATAMGARAIAIAEETLGPSHPTTTQIHGSLCSVALQAKELDAGRDHCHKAHAGQLAASKPDNPALAGTLNNLGFLAINEGDLELALARFKEALTLLEAGGRSEHAYAAMTLQNIAICLEQLGRTEESLVAMDRAIELTEQASPDPLELAVVLYNAGTVAHRKRLFDRATRYLRRSVELAADPELRLHPVVVNAKYMLGAMEVDRGNTDVALPLLEKAVKVFDAQPKLSPEAAATARMYLGRALLATDGDRDRARELARKAESFFAAQPQPNLEALDNVRALLAEL